MSTSTRMFDHYEAEYLAATRKAAQEIEQVDLLLPGIERTSVVKSATAAIEAADASGFQLQDEALRTLTRDTDLQVREAAERARRKNAASRLPLRAGGASSHSGMLMVDTKTRVDQR